MRIGVIVVPEAFDSTLTTVLDVLSVAEEQRVSVDPDIPRIENVICGIGRSARTRRGLSVPIEQPLLGLDPGDFDLLVVPALGVIDVADLRRILALPATRTVRGFLRDLGPGDRPRLAGACTGTFLLAEAGCLDDHRATTSWWLSAHFSARYPQVTLDMTRMVVDSGTIVTAGAAFAHIDLAINIVSMISPRLAQRVANRLLIDERPARSIDAALEHLARSDELINAFDDWVRAHLDGQIDLTTAAREIGTTRRTLERRTRDRLGITPLQLVHRIRIERANHLRRTTEQSMEQIARAVGYRSAATLSRLLRTGG